MIKSAFIMFSSYSKLVILNFPFITRIFSIIVITPGKIVLKTIPNPILIP